MGLLLILILVVAVFVIAKAIKSKKAPIAPPGPRGLADTPRSPAPTRVATEQPRPVRWIVPNEPTVIADLTISSGMFYLGQASKASQIGQTANCIIDPKLRVASAAGDKLGNSMSYWPSYVEIDSKCRRTYLEWLAGGRRDPAVGIGYVFLFFYGLERRFFIDEAKQDAALIEAEVRRLLSIYGENGSFQGYATQFLDAILLLTDLPRDRPPLSLNLRSGYTISTRVRVYLGMRLSEETPFDAEDALLWLLSLPDYGLRTPATRCFEEFTTLWKQRFAQQWPAGYTFKPPTARFKFQYHGASGIDAAVSVAADNVTIPDITEASSSLPPLKDLAIACTDALDGYSRLLGRKPDARGTLEATLLLPPEIRACVSSLASAVSASLDQAFGSRPIAILQTEQLLKTLRIDVPSDGKITAAVERNIGMLLDSLDIGFEPDSRYGTAHLGSDGQIVLFKIANGGPVDTELDAYAFSRISLEAAALAAWTDGKLGIDEFNVLKSIVYSAENLKTADRVRLLAYAAILGRISPPYSSVIAKVGKLDQARKRQIGTTCVAAIVADKDTSPAEVHYLEKLYKTLGIPATDLYSDLHRRADSTDEPVVVMPSEADRGTPIPKRPQPTESTIRLDHDRLARIRKETSSVSEMLSQIFVDGETGDGGVATPQTSGGSISGLDGQHANLLKAIMSANGFTRAAYEAKARELQLLPDGALETINDWGFETFDEPVIEDEDVINVSEHLRAQIQKLGVKT